MRRWLGVLLALVVVSLLVAGPASALTVRRTFFASMGTGGANGTATLQGYTDGTGTLNLALRGLPALKEFKLEIRSGKCSPVGTLRATAFPAVTDAAGTVATFRNLPSGTMNRIWAAAQKGAIVLRVTNPGRTVCGALTFPRATRIAISALSINLAVIPGTASYPKCNVAMYLQTLWQPREPGVTFLYAHARKGMFLPLLTRSKTRNGASMLGMTVKVYTSDSKVHTYRIDKVRRHVRSAQSAIGITSERLWLQTSEGPNFRYPKLIVEAARVSTANATYAASHPRARPISC